DVPDFRKEITHYYCIAQSAPGLLSKAAVRSRWTAAPPIEEESENEWMEGPKLDAWPRPIWYETEHRNTTQLATQFLAQRPGDLIVSDGVFYTLQADKIWAPLSEDELRAEI